QTGGQNMHPPDPPVPVVVVPVLVAPPAPVVGPLVIPEEDAPPAPPCPPSELPGVPNESERLRPPQAAVTIATHTTTPRFIAFDPRRQGAAGGREPTLCSHLGDRKGAIGSAASAHRCARVRVTSAECVGIGNASQIGGNHRRACSTGGSA